MVNHAVFLDRDGVLVVPVMRDGRAHAPRSLEDFRFYPGSKAELFRLKAAGYKLVVVTNQPDVGNGFITRETLDAMTERLTKELGIDLVAICAHSQDEACHCRKPSAELLRGAALKLEINLDTSFMVGDRDIDITAGERAGCKTIYIDRGYANEPEPERPDYTVRSVAEAVNLILGRDQCQDYRI